MGLEFFALAGLCALTAFLAATFGDATDTVKHLFLFNLMTDTFLVSSVVCGWALIRREVVR